MNNLKTESLYVLFKAYFRIVSYAIPIIEDLRNSENIDEQKTLQDTLVRLCETFEDIPEKESVLIEDIRFNLIALKTPTEIKKYEFYLFKKINELDELLPIKRALLIDTLKKRKVQFELIISNPIFKPIFPFLIDENSDIEYIENNLFLLLLRWDLLKKKIGAELNIEIESLINFLKDEDPPQEEPTNKQKLLWNGTVSQFGFIIDLLIQGGYVEKPTSSYLKDADLYLKLFSIKTTLGTLTKELSESTNNLIIDNRNLFKIPHRDKLK